MANQYNNLPVRKLYAELATEHNKFLKAVKMYGTGEVVRTISGNIKAIMEVLNNKVHAFSNGNFDQGNPDLSTA